MAGPANKGYKRSWKNLLLNKRYQLRFTLFMVGVAAMLMACLGIWVMYEANDATAVAKNHIVGEPCTRIPQLVEPAAIDDTPAPTKLDDDTDTGSAAAPTTTMPSSTDPKDVAKHNAMADVLAVQQLWCTNASCKAERAMPLVVKVAKCDAWVKDKLTDPVLVDALKTALIPVVKCEGGTSFSVSDATPPEHHVKVQIDESSMKLTPELPKIPADYTDSIVKHWECNMRHAAQLEDTEAKQRFILYIMLATGVLLAFGLAIYGIKMTHRVAGPLFKISLYLAKMKDGRYDKVYNLRKGDQLVEFYDHFKTAHAGVVKLEQEDIDQLKTVIAAAKEGGCGDHEVVRELETLLARKEKSIAE
jgi:hypothetical protein